VNSYRFTIEEEIRKAEALRRDRLAYTCELGHANCAATSFGSCPAELQAELQNLDRQETER
jgi:hypothetical protein